MFSLFIIISVIGLTAIASTGFGARYLDKRIVEPISNLSNGELSDNSIRKRLDLNISGFFAFTQKPFFGYGLQNTVEAANNVKNTLTTDTHFKMFYNPKRKYANNEILSPTDFQKRQKMKL